MTTTTGTKTPAAIIIEGMIARNDAAIELNDHALDEALHLLESRIANTRMALAKGYAVDSNWLREAAHKAEDAITKREVLAREASSLAHVLKAAQPA